MIAAGPQKPRMQSPMRAFMPGHAPTAAAAYARKRAAWATTKVQGVLRQAWADVDFMRGHLKAAGIRIRDNNEPASPQRLRRVLRRAGVMAPEIRASVGADITGFLRLNPNLPLWAAVALVLEATGRFTPTRAPE